MLLVFAKTNIYICHSRMFQLCFCKKYECVTQSTVCATTQEPGSYYYNIFSLLPPKPTIAEQELRPTAHSKTCVPSRLSGIPPAEGIKQPSLAAKTRASAGALPYLRATQTAAVSTRRHTTAAVPTLLLCPRGAAPRTWKA